MYPYPRFISRYLRSTRRHYSPQKLNMRRKLKEVAQLMRPKVPLTRTRMAKLRDSEHEGASHQAIWKNQASQRKVIKPSELNVVASTLFPETWIWTEDKTEYVI